MPCCFGCGRSPSMRRAMPREPQSAVARAVPAAPPCAPMRRMWPPSQPEMCCVVPPEPLSAAPRAPSAPPDGAPDMGSPCRSAFRTRRISQRRATRFSPSADRRIFAAHRPQRPAVPAHRGFPAAPGLKRRDCRFRHGGSAVRGPLPPAAFRCSARRPKPEPPRSLRFMGSIAHNAGKGNLFLQFLLPQRRLAAPIRKFKKQRPKHLTSEQRRAILYKHSELGA